MPIGISTETATLEASEIEWRKITPVLLIAALGFFVDVYDMMLFTLVRIPSLTALGVPPSQALNTGIMLFNMQMGGMVLGGTIWGILGDKKGRRSILFGSIALYSIATLLNGFVNSVPAYAVLRLLAGIGLSGEVGAAMTIAAEVMPAKYRGYGTGFVSGFATLGAVLASFINNFLAWRTMYITAGIAGLLLLLLRMSVKETALFTKSLENQEIKRGSLKQLFLNKQKVLRLIKCAFTGAPNWYLIGILVAFAPEVCCDTAHRSLINIGAVLASFAIGETIGEAACGASSQLLRSRRKALLLFVAGAFILSLVVLRCPAQLYALVCFPIGIFGGFWGMSVTTAAEQFGTNLRSTATTLVPNLIRASVVGITIMFSALSAIYGANTAALLTAMFWFGCSLLSIFFLDETFQKDLDFVET